MNVSVNALCIKLFNQTCSISMIRTLYLFSIQIERNNLWAIEQSGWTEQMESHWQIPNTIFNSGIHSMCVHALLSLRYKAFDRMPIALSSQAKNIDRISKADVPSHSK